MLFFHFVMVVGGFNSDIDVIFWKGGLGEASDLQKACRGHSERGRIFHVEKESRDSVTFRGKVAVPAWWAEMQEDAPTDRICTRDSLCPTIEMPCV
jgi:hypothetical protein